MRVLTRAIAAFVTITCGIGSAAAANYAARCEVEQVCPLGSECLEPSEATVVTLSNALPPRYIAEVAGVVFGAAEVEGDAPRRRDFVGRSPTGTAYLISIVPGQGFMVTAQAAVPGAILPITMTGRCSQYPELKK